MASAGVAYQVIYVLPRSGTLVGSSVMCFLEAECGWTARFTQNRC